MRNKILQNFPSGIDTGKLLEKVKSDHLYAKPPLGGVGLSPFSKGSEFDAKISMIRSVSGLDGITMHELDLCVKMKQVASNVFEALEV